MEGYHVILDCITKYRYLPNIHESSKIRIFLTNFKFSNVYMTTTLDEIKEILLIMNKNIEKMNEKMDVMSSKLDGEVIDECKKMGSHINFVEGVYDSMKHPLNYICDTINGISLDKQICNDKITSNELP